MSGADGARAAALVGRWVRPEVRALGAYQVANAEGLIKLDAMENPYPWPADGVQAWLDSLAALEINRYPDPEARGLKQRLRNALGLSPDQALLLGNGSDELIQIAAMAVAGPGRVLMAPEPSFVMYRLIAQALGLRYVGVPLREEDFSLDLAAMLEALEREQPALLFIAWPNNPTGNLFPRSEVERLVAAAPGLVVVDEAYSAFAGESLLDALGRYPNLLVMRTLSKLGLAGLRIGLLAGPAAWLEELNKLRLPYNINTLSQASAAFMLDHVQVLEDQAGRIRADRERLAQGLAAQPGVRVYPSRTNFLLFRVAGAGAVFRGLKRRGVLIKCLDGSHPLLADCLRVTVGRPEENQAFLQALGQELSAP